MSFLSSRHVRFVLSMAWLLAAASLVAQPAFPRPSEGDPLVVGTKEAPPFAMKKPDGSWTGLSIQLWEQVAQDLGLEPGDYVYREMDLGPLLDQLEAKELDIGVAALTITPGREEKIDFTHPYFSAGLGLAIYEARPSLWLAVLRALFSKAFFSAVLALGLVLLAAAVAVWFFERKRNKEQFGGPPLQGLGSGFWWSAVTMTTVGYGDKAPQTFGGRLVALVWMFASIIIISSFTAAIASSITVENLDVSLLKSKPIEKFNFAVVENSSGESYCQTAGLRYQAHAGLDEALAALSRRQCDAVLHDKPLLKYRLLTGDWPQLGMLPDTLVAEDYAFALPQGSPLREALNISIIKTTQDEGWSNLKRRYLGD